MRSVLRGLVWSGVLALLATPAAFAGVKADFIGSPLWQTCCDTPVQFVDQSEGNVKRWTWDLGDGLSSEQNPLHQYTDPGLYAVSLTVSGPMQGDEDTLMRRWYITMPPDVKFSADKRLVKPGEAVQFHNDTYEGTKETFWHEWYFGDGTSSIAEHPTHVYAQPGRYTVALLLRSHQTFCVGVKQAIDYIVVRRPLILRGIAN